MFVYRLYSKIIYNMAFHNEGILQYKKILPRVIFFLGRIMPVVDGGLVEISLAPGDLPPLGLLAPR